MLRAVCSWAHLGGRDVVLDLNVAKYAADGVI